MGAPVVGVLRLVAALAVVLLGTLAVLDILPRELLQTWGIKMLLVTGIIGVVALVAAQLARKGSQ